MKVAYRDLLKPDILHSIKGLELMARIIVNGYLSGLNHSKRVGAGMEFSQYRSYQQGDDLRLLDWKVLARSSRYYIKQAEVETNIAVKFIIDASASLQHKEGEISKMDFIRILVASMGYLAKHQGDAVGLFGLNDRAFYSVYPRVEKQHFNRFLHQLVEISSHGKWPESSAATEKLHDRRHKELIIFLSDLYEHSEELTDFVKRLKTKRNEVLVLHVVSPNELSFGYRGSVTFEDLETGKHVKIDAERTKAGYLQSVGRWLETLKITMIENGIEYEMFNTESEPGYLLNAFLKKRKALL